MADTSAGIAAIVDPTLWDPVPVTLPTYVSKPAATRRTVRTIDLDDTGVWTSGRTDADAQIAREADGPTRPHARPATTATSTAPSGPDRSAVGPADAGVRSDVAPRRLPGARADRAHSRRLRLAPDRFGGSREAGANVSHRVPRGAQKLGLWRSW